MKYFTIMILAASLLHTDYKILSEDLPMDDAELRCLVRCDAKNKPAIMFGQPEQCYCLTELDFLKKYYPSKYREKVKGMKK